MNDLNSLTDASHVRSGTELTAEPVRFHGIAIPVCNHEGAIRVAMKPICNGIGLSWHGQVERIRRHPVLSATVRVIRMVAEDGKIRDLLTLPLDKLNGWLFGIDSSRVRPAVRDQLVAYQRECFDVLAAHWGVAYSPSPIGNKIGFDGHRVIQNLIAQKIKHVPELAKRRARAHLWQVVHDRFDVTKARDISSDQMSEACNLVAAWSLEGEFIPRDDTPQQSCPFCTGPNAMSRSAPPGAKLRYIVAIDDYGRVTQQNLASGACVIDPSDKGSLHTVLAEFVPINLLAGVINLSVERLNNQRLHLCSRQNAARANAKSAWA